MSRLRRYHRQGVIWLAAIVLLAGAAPRVGCICPDGTRKFVCCRMSSNAQGNTCPCCAKNCGTCGRCQGGAGGTQPTRDSRPCRPVFTAMEFVSLAVDQVVPIASASELICVLDRPLLLLPIQAAILGDRTSCLPQPDICTTFQVRLI